MALVDSRESHRDRCHSIPRRDANPDCGGDGPARHAQAGGEPGSSPVAVAEDQLGPGGACDPGTPAGLNEGQQNVARSGTRGHLGDSRGGLGGLEGGRRTHLGRGRGRGRGRRQPGNRTNTGGHDDDAGGHDDDADRCSDDALPATRQR